MLLLTILASLTCNGYAFALPQQAFVDVDQKIPADLPRRDDVLKAAEAVRRACNITERLQPDSTRNEERIGTVEKADLSPVTVADFAVQGLILDSLHTHFPDDGLIAEEDSSSLRANESIIQRVADAAGLSTDEILHAIDLGKSYRDWKQRPTRVWCLDPIDGTRGFLRGKIPGGQYAIALALLEDGVPVIGVLGCPNLPTGVDDDNYEWKDGETSSNNLETRGCLFVASRGGGCFQLSLHGSGKAARLHVTSDNVRPIRDARFCIGVEKYSDALGQVAGMAKDIHGKDRALDENGEIINARRIDSQAKHGVIARGGAELYVRLPKPGYIEWIWDHAAGNVVIEEAGGTMSDVDGRTIDFSLGAQLSPSVKGVLMSPGHAFHKTLVNAYAAVATE